VLVIRFLDSQHHDEIRRSGLVLLIQTECDGRLRIGDESASSLGCYPCPKNAWSRFLACGNQVNATLSESELFPLRCQGWPTSRLNC